MFATQFTTSNSLIKAIDIDGALTVMFNKNSPKWKAMKKLRKSGKMTTLSYFGESVWNTIREVKASITGSIEHTIFNPAISFLQHLKMFHESDKAIDNVEAAPPIIVTKAANTNTEVCANFYAALNLKCLKYQMTPPIILYGRLFEEERFQYVSFIFGKRAFIIEMETNISDTQERACETMCALIRKSAGLPKVSLFIKILGNVAHIAAEIDMENETFTISKSIPDDLEIVNLNEMLDLIIASHYLSRQPYTRIEEICAQTQFYKQPFLEGLYVNKCVFGYVHPADDTNDARQSQHPIMLVFCDTTTQSNFLWNNKPLTVNAKALMSKYDYQASAVPYQKFELLSLDAVSDANECGGGIRYGDQILYEGPLVVIFD